MSDNFRLDPRLSGMNPHVLRNRKESPLRFSIPVLEIAAIKLSALVSPAGRELMAAERDIVKDIFRHSVNVDVVRITETRILNAPTVLGNQIRVPFGWNSSAHRRAVLVHEFMHIWQYQTQGTRYISDSVYHNVHGRITTGNRNVAYLNYQLKAGSNIADFSAEEQATIVADYYELTRIHPGSNNPPPWVTIRSPDLPIYERLIEQVRNA